MTLLAAIVLANFACKKEKDYSEPLPDCINEKVEQFKKNSESIGVFTIVNDSERVYWFKVSDYAHEYDACDFIYNENCEVVCGFGGLCPQTMINCPELDNPDWETIWEN